MFAAGAVGGSALAVTAALNLAYTLEFIGVMGILLTIVNKVSSYSSVDVRPASAYPLFSLCRALHTRRARKRSMPGVLFHCPGCVCLLCAVNNGLRRSGLQLLVWEILRPFLAASEEQRSAGSLHGGSCMVAMVTWGLALPPGGICMLDGNQHLSVPPEMHWLKHGIMPVAKFPICGCGGQRFVCFWKVHG